MKTSVFVLLYYVLLAVAPAAGGPSDAAVTTSCDVSDPMFVCGLRHPEDLIQLGNTPWVVATAINFTMGDPPSNFGPGPLNAIRIDTHAVHHLYPTPESEVRWDRKAFPECSAPPRLFSSHGLNSRPLSNETYRLYVVNHGDRESVEVVDVAVRGEQLHAMWRGCMRVSVKDLRIWPNAIAPLPDGGLVLAGYNVALWRAGEGWKRFQSYQGATPGVEGGAGFANGVETSRDGKWIFIADTDRKSVIRIPINGGQQTQVALNFTPDNLRWGQDGLLYVAGPIWPKWEHAGDVLKCFQQPICVTGIGVASIDPQTLAMQDVVHNKEGIRGKFGSPTTALQIGDHLWIGTSRGNRALIVDLKPRN